MSEKKAAKPVFRRISASKSGTLTPHKVTDAALARAVSLHLEGKLEAALSELNDAIKSGKREVVLFTAAAHIQYELHEFEEAVNSYSKVLDMAPEHRTAQYNKAVCLSKLGRWEEAALCFEKAMRIDPTRLEAQLGLGACLLR